MTGKLGNGVDQFRRLLGLVWGLFGHVRLLALGAFVLVSGCGGDLSILDPAGPAARDIASLWWVMFSGSTAIFLFVTALVVLSFRNGGHEHSDSALERRWILGLGLGFSMAVLAALLAYGIAVGVRLTAAPQDAETVRANATLDGWTFRAGGTTTNGVLHIPAGRDIVVEITTGDVIHSFWVPRLAGKIDAIPGHVNTLHLHAEAPGEYAGLSSEYSGPGYADRRFIVRAHDAESWQAILQESVE